MRPVTVRRIPTGNMEARFTIDTSSTVTRQSHRISLVFFFFSMNTHKTKNHSDIKELTSEIRFKSRMIQVKKWSFCNSETIQ